jgi:ribonuclease-3
LPRAAELPTFSTRSRILWASAARTHRWFSASSQIDSGLARTEQGEASWDRALERLQQKLQVGFANRELLKQAFTHSSYAGPNHRGLRQDNERLEFLGDAVLELVISHLLYTNKHDRDEGVLTQMRSQLVNRTALAQLARGLDLQACLRLGKGEAASGGAHKDSINANCLEALLGALYLDRPWETVFSVVERLFAEPIVEITSSAEVKDPKSLLQEVSLARYSTLPRYIVVGQRGREHDKVFQVKVMVGNRLASTGHGSSKKAAEQEAATLALKRLNR